LWKSHNYVGTKQHTPEQPISQINKNRKKNLETNDNGIFYMSTRFTWSKVWFKSNVSVLTFCLDDLSLLQVGYWSPYYNYIVVFLQICICLIYLDIPMLGALIFTIVISSWLIDSYYYIMTFFVCYYHFLLKVNFFLIEV